ncbi:MAG: hypothetical protein QOI66_1493, partial [Myxococcales bacterium]|nr:hypothetical protein [Myxococcales bacterium]
MGKVSIVLVALFSLVLVGDGVAVAAPDPFAWTPRDAPAVVRGREAAKRFDLLSTWEITLEVDNAFTQANRRALAALERNLARIDGVRRVLGPSSLLSVAVDAGGDVSTRPLFDSESGEIDSDAESDAIRQEVGRRADAAGWFVSTDGRTVRLLVDSDDFDRVRPAVTVAIAGGALRSAPDWIRPARAATLWPDPRDALVSWLPLAMAAGWILFIWIAGAPAWRDAGTLPPGGLVAVMIAAGLGA